MKKVLLLTLWVMSTVLAYAQTAADYNIIKEQPAGELKIYDRGGNSYYVYNGYIRGGAQTGEMDIVYGADNKVWIKDPLAKFPVGSWVEGTLSTDGKTITVPLGQYIHFDTEANQAITLEMFTYDDEEEDLYISTIKEATYTINNDKITLNGTSRYGNCLGAAWASDKQWAGFADYGSSYTPHIDDELVEAPAGMETKTYKFQGTDYNSSSSVTYNVTVGTVGNDVYMQGIFADTPNAWIKGVRSDSIVTFEPAQFLGKMTSNGSARYMIAVDRMNTSNIQPLTLIYDASADSYRNSTQFLVLNMAKNTVYLMQAISDFTLTLSKYGNAYDVPYTENFGSSNSLRDYTIIDANNDSRTWIYNSLNGSVEYNYNPNNAGDDWLITPAIHLEAGKQYIFALKARSFTSTEPERMEVKMGMAPTVKGMTTTVIAATNVATGDPTEFSHTVSTSSEGEYYFGIHAISDANNMMLRIDDVSLTEAEETGIATVRQDRPTDGACYTLNGQRVSRPAAKGLYIVDGRKVVVR